MPKNSHNRRPLNEDGTVPSCLCCGAPALKHINRQRWKATCSTECAKQLITQKMTATKNNPEWVLSTGIPAVYKAIATQRKTVIGGRTKAELTAEKIRTANSKIDENGLTGYHKASRKAAVSVRATNESRGHWKRLEDKAPFDQYRAAVSMEQRRFNSHIQQLENYNKRAPSGVDDGYHIDHRVSLWFGFQNKIPPKVIGHICNLEMKHWLDNNRKWSKCDLALDDLLKAIEIFERTETLSMITKKIT